MAPALVYDLGRVAVTGGNGFLGRQLVHLLQKERACREIDVLDIRRPDAAAAAFPGPGQDGVPVPVRFRECDITDAASVGRAFDQLRPDVVFHTASPQPDAPAHVLTAVNVDGTARLLATARAAGVAAFVYTSSASVVLDRSDGRGLVNADERWPVVAGPDLAPAPLLDVEAHSGRSRLHTPRSTEWYSTTKSTAECLVLAANSRGGAAGAGTSDGAAADSDSDEPAPPFLTCALRPAGIFGEGDAQFLPSLAAALGLHRSEHGEPRIGRAVAFQIGANENLFDVTYVGNVAWAHLLAAGRLLATRRALDQAHGQRPAVVQSRQSEPDEKQDQPHGDLDESKRVDGEAFFITNGEPVYFWDFARSVWSEMLRQGAPPSSASPSSSPSSTAPSSPALALPRPYVLPTGLALLLASLAEYAYLIFSLGKSTPRLTRQKVWYSTITRYYNIEKARRRLMYAPLVQLPEAVSRSVAWLVSQPAGDQNQAG